MKCAFKRHAYNNDVMEGIIFFKLLLYIYVGRLVKPCLTKSGIVFFSCFTQYSVGMLRVCGPATNYQSTYKVLLLFLSLMGGSLTYYDIAGRVDLSSMIT